jgi:predicted nucleic acid binding AN1-type Zn finger protein|tara:strand:+ start:3065 stop:3400 length:336 start_codon:yes stop_codon:yes gene_type:complete
MDKNPNFSTKLPPMTIVPSLAIVSSFDNKVTENMASVGGRDVKKKKTKRKCQLKGCKKKLQITAFNCRCDKKFCKLHTSAEKHHCTFDYKSFHRQNLVSGGCEADKIKERV